jgi:hypothetical protein
MRTAQEYQNQIKVFSQAIGFLEQELFKVQMATPIEWTRQKALRKGISDLEQKMKYLAGQRRKSERIEACEDAYIKSLNS